MRDPVARCFMCKQYLPVTALFFVPVPGANESALACPDCARMEPVTFLRRAQESREANDKTNRKDTSHGRTY